MKREDIDRKILFLMSQCPPVSRELYERWKVEFSQPLNNFKGLSVAKKVYNYADNKKISDDIIFNIWQSVIADRHKQRMIMQGKPQRVRKDNKTEINCGSGGSNRNKIRYPKKCRKTAWKRFYKLFPHLKETEK